MRLDLITRVLPLGLLMLAACGGGSPSSAAATNASTPALSTKPAAAHFTYQGAEGPEHWGDLDSAFATCKTGTKQSPVALPTVLRTDPSVAIARPTYAPVPLVMLNNGHTVQVKNTAQGSLVYDGVKYDLAQFHFHSPSEHTIGGKSFDLEMHLVHKSADGKLLVIALMFMKGAENKLLSPLFNALPTEVSETPTTLPNVTIDVASLLPTDLKFEHYEGSLTTPPCTEGVSWFVVEAPVHSGLEVSNDQITRYRSLMHGATNRPPQPLNGRTVVEASAAH